MSTPKIEIELINGMKKKLSELSDTDLPNVKLSEGKDDKGNKVTYFNLKSEIIGETATHKTERRLYKWKKMPSLVMYDIKYGKTLSILEKELTHDVVYFHAIANYLIDLDKQHNGIEGSGKQKSKLSSSLLAKMEAKGVSKAEIEKTRKNLIACGFLKD